MGRTKGGFSDPTHTTGPPRDDPRGPFVVVVLCPRKYPNWDCLCRRSGRWEDGKGRSSKRGEVAVRNCVRGERSLKVGVAWGGRECGVERVWEEESSSSTGVCEGVGGEDVGRVLCVIGAVGLESRLRSGGEYGEWTSGRWSRYIVTMKGGTRTYTLMKTR